jgi:hypothetical protein
MIAFTLSICHALFQKLIPTVRSANTKDVFLGRKAWKIINFAVTCMNLNPIPVTIRKLLGL